MEDYTNPEIDYNPNPDETWLQRFARLQDLRDQAADSEPIDPETIDD